MNKIKKDQGTLVVLCVLIIFFSSFAVSSAQQPDEYVELDTYIKNSKGNYWKPLAENIQHAINDLDNTSGTVFLPGNTVFETNETLILRENVILDMGGCILKPLRDFHVIDLRGSSNVKNGIIDVSKVDDYSHACLLISGVHFIDTQENSIKIFNMELQSENHQGKGIYFYVDDDEQAIGWVRCNVIRTESFEYAIHLNCNNAGESYGSWINGNTFTDLRGRNDKYFIYIERNEEVKEPWSATSGNIFETIQYQTTENSECVIYNEGWGNMFSNVMIWDWQLAGEDKKSIKLTSATRNCFLSYRGGSDDLLDEGVSNTIIDYMQGTIENTSIHSLSNFTMLLLMLIGLEFLFILVLGVSILRKRKGKK